MNFRKKFVVIDPTYKGEHESHQSGAAELARHTASLAQLQYKLYAENKRSLLIILQGFDAAGKDGVIHHVISGTNPQGVNVACFRQPTHEELAHDFLWRAHRHTPANGEIMIFNRSHYEDVLVVRVHGIVPKSVWSKRYDRIREFEKLLIQADTHIVKFYLHISPQEQLTRFKERLEDPHRNWKIRNSDYTEREFGEPILKRSKTLCARQARRAHPGTLFHQTTSGFATSRFRAFSSIPWTRWILKFPNPWPI
jgi:PPK2 family polyphosphate:nucleotide phosphotransferase